MTTDLARSRPDQGDQGHGADGARDARRARSARSGHGAHSPCGACGARGARGASLLEALIGLLLIAAGLLGTAQSQLRLRDATDLARQHGEALQRATQALDDLRSGGLPAAEQPPDAAPGTDTVQRLSTEQHRSPWGQARGMAARVGWVDRHGREQHLRLDGLMPTEEHGLALALTRPTLGLDAGLVHGRHAAVPREATAPGDGTSVLRPAADGAAVWRFDDRHGRLVAQCEVDLSRPLAGLAAADLHGCRPTDAVLLSGRLRADAAAAVPVAVHLERDDGGVPAACLLDRAAGAEGDPHLRYRCAVVPVTMPRADDGDASSEASRQRWSGRLRMRLADSPGTAATRACRYSADTDGSGRIDRPAEHPAAWQAVAGALPEQNLLLVHGRDCPAAAASATAQGLVPWSHANPATVPQPP